MIEISNNKIKCTINSREEEETPRTEIQEKKFAEVIDAYKKADKLFDEYKKEFGTDKSGINKILKRLNGGH